MDEPDPKVVAAARGGDVDAFETLVRRYQADVWRLCFQLLRDEAMAEDVTQDSFVRAYRFLRRYRGDCKFSTWLFTITRNCAYDELRRTKRRRSLADRVAQEPPRPTGGHDGLEIREMVAALPLELREPVVMIDMFGVSYAEVADMLGVPIGTIKSRMHRARGLLSHALAQHGREAQSEG